MEDSSQNWKVRSRPKEEQGSFQKVLEKMSRYVQMSEFIPNDQVHFQMSRFMEGDQIHYLGREEEVVRTLVFVSQLGLNLLFSLLFSFNYFRPTYFINRGLERQFQLDFLLIKFEICYCATFFQWSLCNFVDSRLLILISGF